MKLTIDIDIDGFEMYHDIAKDKDAQELHINEHLYEMIAGFGDWEKFRFTFQFEEESDGTQ